MFVLTFFTIHDPDDFGTELTIFTTRPMCICGLYIVVKFKPLPVKIGYFIIPLVDDTSISVESIGLSLGAI
ncbi:MAG: hypothetical protein LBQ47_07420 [Endomicrobium sp.]|jgi:hypothetical protein|nr:hypothetical protein [Endomicrobium sp.]